MSSQLSSGDTELLAETHAVSAGLKSYVTTAVVEGCEVARRAMGGHGYLDSAGIGRIYATQLPSTTLSSPCFAIKYVLFIYSQCISNRYEGAYVRL